MSCPFGLDDKPLLALYVDDDGVRNRGPCGGPQRTDLKLGHNLLRVEMLLEVDEDRADIPDASLRARVDAEWRYGGKGLHGRLWK